MAAFQVLLNEGRRAEHVRIGLRGHGEAVDHADAGVVATRPMFVRPAGEAVLQEEGTPQAGAVPGFGGQGVERNHGVDVAAQATAGRREAQSAFDPEVGTEHDPAVLAHEAEGLVENSGESLVRNAVRELRGRLTGRRVRVRRGDAPRHAGGFRVQPIENSVEGVGPYR